jgi:hypothetical protein
VCIARACACACACACVLLRACCCMRAAVHRVYTLALRRIRNRDRTRSCTTRFLLSAVRYSIGAPLLLTAAPCFASRVPGLPTCGPAPAMPLSTSPSCASCTRSASRQTPHTQSRRPHAPLPFAHPPLRTTLQRSRFEHTRVGLLSPHHIAPHSPHYGCAPLHMCMHTHVYVHVQCGP